jgi:glucose/arabinose dehydrogenase
MVRLSLARLGYAAALLLALAPAAGASTLPAGFEEVVLATDLDTPTAVDWAPDGRMFVTEKAGVLKVVTPAGAPEAATVLDISDHVNGYGDRGLLGLAVARDFARTGHVYLVYTYELDRLRQDGRKTARVTRVTVRPDNRVAGGERVILGRDGARPCRRLSNTRDCVPADAPTHTIGTVRAAADGTLWLGSGESTAYDISYLNVFHAYRENTFAGKVIHVDGDGRGLRRHPFCPRDRNLAHVCTKLHAKGFRNPFRFTLNGSVPVVGDVGLADREEIDLAEPGGNYGWPCFEGTIRTPAFRQHPRCRWWYARAGEPGAPTAPLHDYPGNPGGVIPGPIFSGSTWPAVYRGRLFFADYTRRFVSLLDLDSGDVTPFGQDVAHAVALEQSPRGQLAFVDIATGEVREIAWSPDNRAPVAAATASSTSGAVPLAVRFSGAGSRDPEEAPLSYEWAFGDGERAEGSQVEHVYTRAGNFAARLTVADPGGRRAVRLIRISPGNTPPRLTLLRPHDGSSYTAGGVMTLRAHATDAEDGELRGRVIAWQAVLDHRGHEHFLLTGLRGTDAGFRVPPDHSADSSFRVTVTARDSGGLETARTVSVRPRTATVRIGSVPRGAPVTFAGRAATSPLTSTEAAGFETVVAAARSFVRGGRRYRFAGWSAGGRRAHALRVPADGLRLRARYRPIP